MALAFNFLILFSLLAIVPHCIANHALSGSLFPQYYTRSCPRALQIVQSVVAKAVAREPRMAASLLRLHFHDCFVKALEVACPETVSCADILALAARDSTVLMGGPHWEVPLGRRDSLGASLSGSNNNIPAPNNTLPTIITKFNLKGLNILDLVALSGSHTIGDSRCASFRQRLYNQTGKGFPDATLDPNYAAILRKSCPKSGGDQNLFLLDFVSPTKFDNFYFKNIIAKKGLLSSDEILFTQSTATMNLVNLYAENNQLFFEQFAKSMIKMGNITPLIGSKGEIRKNCRRLNH